MSLPDVSLLDISVLDSDDADRTRRI